MSTAPAHYRWENILSEVLSPTIDRQMVWGRDVMLARVELKSGANVPLHRHTNEQWSCVQLGALRFFVGPERTLHDVAAGGIMYLPSNVPHEVVALEHSVTIDVFSPPREDWINGTDSYLRSGK